MRVSELLRDIPCACGKTHSCPIQAVCITPRAAEELAQICAPYQRILLVADGNTWDAAGSAVEKALGAKVSGKVIFPAQPLLIPDEAAIETVNAALDGVDLLVAIGSGVLQDLCKYVSFKAGISYAVMATAPSMDGYASDGAAMILGGMKVTVKSHLPIAIVADPRVLAAAPMDMIRAGAGDIIGKFSALNDWKLSRCINGEYFCQFIYDLTYEQIQRVLDLTDDILERKADAVGALMEALVVVGIMMSFAGSSRPASGSEHHLSHFFEITGIVHGTPYFPHGIDVAYATVITAQVRQTLLQNDFPDHIFRLPRAELEAEMHRIYGSSADGCLALQDKVGNYDADRLNVFREKEQEIRAILAEMPAPEKIRDMLEHLGLPMQKFYDFYGEDHIADAVLYAKDLKDRYTVLWLYYDFFGGKRHV
ncbi:MAG: sn-glycerol-1-phosphate dehydrogenase [Oscillospiraceae bacterium]|nr:sn-glycerol-1-phosphate dehydrogenase [Oscillospiraceae bacterium]